jgi:hypothetical protein
LIEIHNWIVFNDYNYKLQRSLLYMGESFKNLQVFLCYSFLERVLLLSEMKKQFRSNRCSLVLTLCWNGTLHFWELKIVLRKKKYLIKKYNNSVNSTNNNNIFNFLFYDFSLKSYNNWKLKLSFSLQSFINVNF